MPFLQIDKPQQRIIPPEGPKTAAIAIIGEAGGAYEEASLRPFVGPAGTVLEQCLHAAGLIRSDVYITNVVKIRPKNNDITPYFNAARATFTDLGRPWVEQLLEELNEVSANVLVPCGGTALAALCGTSKILKYRGYILLSRGLAEPRKVLPCIHPAASIRGQYLYRHLIVNDLRKAKRHADTRELTRPQRQLVYEYGSVDEVLEWLAYMARQPIVSVDIEAPASVGEMTCIGFASSPTIACSVPLDKRWSDIDEIQLWRAIQQVLGNPGSIKIFQNGIFDIQFLAARYGIVTRGPIRDTMVGHSVMYPELRKGLEFLGSLYCGTQEYWKDIVKFDSMKDEA